MNSGKTLDLLGLAFNLEFEKISFIVLKSSIDTRDGENTIHSRAIPGGRPCISISSEDNIVNVVKFLSIDINSLKYILVDEVQFLSIEQIEQLAFIVDEYDINVICYGLKTDFKTEIADEFVQIESYSKYEGNSYNTMFNARINSEGNIVINGKQVEVGGEDRYKAMSRKEFFHKTNNPLYLK